MTKPFWSVAGACLLAIFLAGSVGAQVVMSPGNQVGSPGQTVDFQFSVTGSLAAETAVARFRIAYDANSPFDPVVTAGGAAGPVDCAIAPDLAGRITTGPVFSQPDNGRIVVGFGDFSAPVTSFGREGVILSCKFTIRADAAEGTYPIACLGAASAADPKGNALPSTCVSGQLVVTGGGGGGGRPVAGGLRQPAAPPVAEGGPAPAQPGQPVQQVPAAPKGGSRALGGGSVPVATEGAPGTPLGAEPEIAGTPRAAEAGRGVPTLPSGAAAVATATGPVPTGTAAERTPVPTKAAPSATAVRTVKATAAPAKAPAAEEKGGCEIAASGTGDAIWLLLAPLTGLLLLRRKGR